MQVWYRHKSRFWSNSWLSKIAGRAKCQKHYFTDDEAEWAYNDTVGHVPLAIDRLLDVRTTKWQKQLPTTMRCRSHSRWLTSECLWRPAAWTNTPKRREKRIYLFAVVFLKPKQLIIKDCDRRFVLKLYRHEASRGLSATAELLVSLNKTDSNNNYGSTLWVTKLDPFISA